MTHAFLVKELGLNRYIAQCSCGWESLPYNNSYSANLAGEFHVKDKT